MVTCDDRTDHVLRETVPNVVRLDILTKEAYLEKPNMEVENVDDNDVACVCYTSGTTGFFSNLLSLIIISGLPKGAMLTHGSLSSNAEELVHLWRFSHSDKLIS